GGAICVPPLTSVAATGALAATGANESVGVARGCSRTGEPWFMRYCGPVGKFVSWATQIPARKTSRQQQVARRIMNLPASDITTFIMTLSGVNCQTHHIPLLAPGAGFSLLWRQNRPVVVRGGWPESHRACKRPPQDCR